jgi:hypothetical protein
MTFDEWYEQQNKGHTDEAKADMRAAWDAATQNAAALCWALANGYVSDVNPNRSIERMEAAQHCARAILNPPKPFGYKP